MKATSDGCGCFPTGRHYPGIAHLLRARVAGVAEEFSADDPWMDLPIAFLDTETTGREAASDHIVEIGIIVGQGGQIRQRFNWLIHPGVPIPEAAAKIHGITDDDVKDQPRFDSLLPDICAALAKAIPAAYNAGFDRGFLLAEMQRSATPLPASTPLPPALRNEVVWLDPLVWARHIQKYEKGKTLAEVAARLGIPLDQAHRASDDAEAALLVLYALGRDERVPRKYGALIQEQQRLGRIQEEEFARWRSRQ